ncbi:hypothetical protein GGR56DRAFT_627481 [Xylariaceae sp. FL0804]|nr:hypothetical protein GGR56DRAFT_627481 [Xylariaceae sp. FL0804]
MLPGCFTRKTRPVLDGTASTADKISNGPPMTTVSLRLVAQQQRLCIICLAQRAVRTNWLAGWLAGRLHFFYYGETEMPYHAYVPSRGTLLPFFALLQTNVTPRSFSPLSFLHKHALTYSTHTLPDPIRSYSVYRLMYTGTISKQAPLPAARKGDRSAESDIVRPRQGGVEETQTKTVREESRELPSSRRDPRRSQQGVGPRNR